LKLHSATGIAKIKKLRVSEAGIYGSRRSPHYCGNTGPILSFRNVLLFFGYNTSTAVSKPSEAIFLSILLFWIRRTMYNASQLATPEAIKRISKVFIIVLFMLFYLYENSASSDYVLWISCKLVI
jgi:hypothetical protein